MIMAKEKEFKLPEEPSIVKIKFNPYNPGPIKNPRHVAYVKLEGCFDSYVCATDRNGRLKNPFTKEEKEYLEKVLEPDRGPNSLSVYNKEGVIHEFDEMPIRLGKEPLILDKSDPMDYIKLKVLLTNTETVCPDIKDLKNKKSYRYYVEDEESVSQVKKESSNKNMRAWKAYAKMESDKSNLISFLKVYSRVKNRGFNTYAVNNKSKIELIQSKVVEIVENDIDTFLSIVENDSYDTMVLIAEAVEVGKITKQGTSYFLDNEKIGNNLENTIQYIDSPANQEVKIILEQYIKNKS